MSTKTKADEQAADIAALLRARNPLLWIVTREEQRVEGYLMEAASAAKYPCMTWDCAQGVCDMAGRPQNIGSNDPGEMLKSIINRAQNKGGRCVWIMRDLPPWLVGPMGIGTCRMLRNVVRMLPTVDLSYGQAIFILSPDGNVPPELSNSATVIEWPLPDRAEIGRILDSAISVLPEKLQAGAAPNGTRDAAIDAAVGLSGEEAQACYSKSLVTTQRIDPAAVAQEKRRVVARERVLEWYDPLPGGLDAVGGLDLLKGWLVSRRSAYSPAARSYGLPAPKGALLVGIPGCLSEGTRIPYKRGKRPAVGDRSLPIEVLCAKFNGADRVLGMGRAGAGSRWLPNVPTYTQSWDNETGCMVFNEITAVMPKGIKNVIQITTETAGTVELTADHPVLCADGSFHEAGDIKAGHVLLVRGSMKPVASGKQRTYAKRVVVEGLLYHPLAWRKIVIEGDKRYEYGRTTRARLVIEAAMNKIDYAEFVAILKEDPERAETLAYLPSGYDVHHADENPMNDDWGNLVVVPHDEHARLHNLVGNFNVEHTAQAKVTAVRHLGLRMTYDITMAEPHTNFAVNDGIIVHNCGKSLTAKAIATAWGVPLLKLDLNALKSKFVGESEGNLRRALRVVEAIGRCVVWIDELEKALAGATSGGADGGVSMDALGTVLNWMQERAGEAFVIATANDVTTLPPELMRKGRFDEIWWVDLPTITERADICIVALRAHGRKDAQVDFSRVAQVTEGFTGSEIASLIPEAMYVAFADGAREIATEDLVAAASTVVPMSKTSAEKISKLREWSVGRARAATTPEIATTGTVASRQLQF